MGRMCGNAYRNTVVCIDSYENKILKGRFYNAFDPSGVCFDGLMDFLLKMEGMLDKMDLPQSFSAKRTFASSNTPWQTEDAAEKAFMPGERATFEMRILFRQNTSWQGCLTWMEEDREESFRSVLELALLMDSALESQKTQE